MGRLRSNGLRLAVAILSLWSFSGCGGGTKAGPPIFPGRVTLLPGGNSSLVLGGTLNFTTTVQTSSGTNIATPVTFSSTDTSVLTLAPNGVACAGHWDVAFTACTPGGTGVVQVTATALGTTSGPTWVFVHPPIDNITVTGVLLDNVPVQEPCLSQSQSMTVEAHAFSHGSDITSAVGPFTFSANNPTVVNLVPVLNTAYNFATNQATATALNPGITQIYASAAGVSSSSFQQAQYQNSQGTTSPALDFYSTCPIQSIALQVGSGSQQSGQISFAINKGTSQTVTAVLTDLMGFSSLPNTNGQIVLSKIPLTWTSSQPAVLTTPAGCLESCAISTPLAGSGTVTASCSPPTCNIGFPVVPLSLSTQALVDSCTQFFGINCQQLIPVPVYASPLPASLGPLPGSGAISGIVTGSTTAATVLATSTGCEHEPPSTCNSSIYSLSTSKAATGSENPFPVAPNSLLYDLTGDKVFMGSDFGAQLINPANFGTANPAFTSLGTVTGTVLASSNNGTVGVFSDTLHIPNQVYVVNAANTTTLSASALNITGATAAAFSPDGLKTFIAGVDSASSVPDFVYVYSSLTALQGPIALTGPAKSIAFSPNGAFAFVAEASTTTGSNNATLAAYAVCNNQFATSIPLPADPLVMKVLPEWHIDGSDSSGIPIPDGVHVFVLDATGFDVITATIALPTAGTLCPQALSFNPVVQRVELNQGTLQPLNFFTSSDASLLYVASSSNASILVYDFGTGAVTGIELQGNATPLSADISVDDGVIAIAGSDGMLHEVNTGLGGADQVPLSFPNLPNYLNPFCSFTPTAGPCTLNLVAVKP